MYFLQFFKGGNIVIENKTVTAIILVAGNSTRFGQNRNKNFELVNGKSILSYSINVFDKNQYIDNIIVVIKQDDKETVEQIIDKENITKKIDIVTIRQYLFYIFIQLNYLVL